MAESPADEKPHTSPSLSSSRSDYSPSHLKPESPDEVFTPWINYAAERARLAQKTVDDSIDFAISTSRSRLDRFFSTGSAHLNQTIDSLREVKSEFDVYEDLAFAKIKEGVLFAASHPVATCSVATGLGFLVLKRARHFLYYNSVRLFVSEESLLSRAESKAKDLRQSVDLLKAERDKLEKKALQAEEEMTRGQTKLRQAGKQIQGVISSAYKIERQVGGLKDELGELPRREASQFRSQVSNLASEAKRERKTLNQKVSQISNYGISV